MHILMRIWKNKQTMYWIVCYLKVFDGKICSTLFLSYVYFWEMFAFNSF